MRSRFIRPGFFSNESLAELTCDRRLAFVGLWCVADKAGRLEDRPRRLRAELFPYDDVDMEAIIIDLERAGFVLRYEAGGGRYIEVCNFSKHQCPHHTEKESEFPPPPEGLTVKEPLPNGEGATESRDGHSSVTSNKGSVTGKQQSVSPLSPDALSLCDLLKARVLANDSKAKTPDTFTASAGWGKEARLLLEFDGRTVEEARDVIEWATADSFWKSHVLSMAKLREKFSTLKMQAENPKSGTGAAAGRNAGLLSREPADKFKGR